MEENKIIFINQKLSGQEPAIPKFLYKYRPFDGYTYDMLDNAYLYLCPAKNLDDPSECTVSFDIQDYFDIESNRLNFRCVELILEIIRPHTSEENFRHMKSVIARTITPGGYVKRNWLLDASFELQKHAPSEDCIALVNWLGNIPEMLDSPTIRPQMEKLFLAAYAAREEMGICSLSQLENSIEMWENYTNDSSGYCIEFDMSDYSYNDAIFPVVYDDERANNIVMTIVSDFIAQAIHGISSGQLKADRSNYIRMFLTKETKWSYQKEWRIIGDGNTRIQAPKIRTIYLGKEVSDSNRQKMLEYCSAHNINCTQR